MNIRQVESVIYRQFIEEDIKDGEIVNEGIIRNAINKASGKFIQTALADEIEKGKELEKSIKEALDGLNKGFDEIEKQIGTDDDDKKSKSKLARIEKVKEAIKAVQSQAFDTLTMIGSEGEIDFAGFLGSGTVAAAANFGILFSPIRSLFITRKAYKYFLGIIKQTIRRNLLIIQLNFDQFENLILQKSFETEDDSEDRVARETMAKTIAELTEHLCKDKSLFKKESQHKKVKAQADIFLKLSKERMQWSKENAKRSPYGSLFNDQYNNTYTKTLEQIKQYINEDSQKELDSLKNSITKMAGNDVELVQYGELIISAAEEYAIHTNHGINNNFIKMSSVFNLDNQKKLIELIEAAQKENQAEIERKKKEQDIKESEEKLKNNINDGKKLYEEKLKDSTETYTLDKFEEEFDEDDIKSLKAFFNTEEGEKAFEELKEKNPLYKYIFIDDTTLNKFLSSLNDLNVVEISDLNDFYSTFVKKDQALYYTMAEISIKDAIKSIKSEDYFGFSNIKDDYVEKGNILNVDKDDTTKSEDEEVEEIKPNVLNSILNNIIGKNKTKDGKITNKTKYFLTFNGDGNNLFDILHKDFKTIIFDESGKYASDIKTDSKEALMKLIYKNLKIGNSISKKFAEYLVRLNAHMLLKNKKPWFVAKNNNKLYKCFVPNADEIQNKNAFVEISAGDYEDTKRFLNRLHGLSDNDFNLEETKKEEKTK
jgi:hypothetical protein